MPKAKFLHSRIEGIVGVHGSIQKCIDDEVDNYGGNLEQIKRIKETIGLNVRFVADENTTALDLCTSAAKELLSLAERESASIDALIFVTQTPDHFQPSNASIAHKYLKLKKDCAAFDVNLGCSGYVYGLWLAAMMVETQSCKTVLLVAGDTMSKCVNPRDRSVAPLFGDAGSATLIKYSDEKRPSWYSLYSDGKGSEHILIPAGGFRQRADKKAFAEEVDSEGNSRSPADLFINGAEVFNFSIKEEPPSVKSILEYAGLSGDSIDAFVFHQANRYIVKNVARRLNIPLEKLPLETVEKFGNQSCASIPFTLCHCLSETLRSAKLQVLLSGFGSGLSWASSVLMLEQLKVCRIKQF